MGSNRITRFAPIKFIPMPAALMDNRNTQHLGIESELYTAKADAVTIIHVFL